MRANLTKQGPPRPRQDVWRSYLDEWDRALLSSNRPPTTRYNYELAVTQFADFLAGDELDRFVEEQGQKVRDDS